MLTDRRETIVLNCDREPEVTSLHQPEEVLENDRQFTINAMLCVIGVVFAGMLGYGIIGWG